MAILSSVLICHSLLPLVARGDTLTFVIVGLLATGWWYLVGQIGLWSNSRRLNSELAVLGGTLILIVCAIDACLMLDEFRRIVHDPTFGGVDAMVYGLAGALLCGGFLSARYTWVKILGRSRN